MIMRSASLLSRILSMCDVQRTHTEKAPASSPALQKAKTLPYPRPVTGLVREPPDVSSLRNALC